MKELKNIAIYHVIPMTVAYLTFIVGYVLIFGK